MSIQGISSKFKGLLKNQEILLALLIIVVSLISFALGRLSVGTIGAPASQNATVLEAGEGTSPSLENPPQKTEDIIKTEKSPEISTGAVATEGGYVASKSGTKYHLPWCSGAKRIKEENKVYFKTKEEAEKAGYTPASNCKGI